MSRRTVQWKRSLNQSRAWGEIKNDNRSGSYMYRVGPTDVSRVIPMNSVSNDNPMPSPRPATKHITQPMSMRKRAIVEKLAKEYK